jgi:Zn-dependent protease
VLFDLPEVVVLGVYYFVAFNVLLAIFNLIPIPPLDGSALLYRILPAEQAWRARTVLGQYGFLILIGVFVLGGRALGEVIFGFTNILVGV